MSAAVNGNAGAGLLALQLGEKRITANAIRVNAALRIENPLPPKRRIIARRACLVLTHSAAAAEWSTAYGGLGNPCSQAYLRHLLEAGYPGQLVEYRSFGLDRHTGRSERISDGY